MGVCLYWGCEVILCSGGVFRRRLETLCLSDGIVCLSQLLRHCTYVDVDSCGGTVCVIVGFWGFCLTLRSM